MGCTCVDTQPGPVATFNPQRPNYGGVPDALILAGAVVGIVMTGFMLLMAAFQFFLFLSSFREAADGLGQDTFPGFMMWIPVFLGVMAVISIIGAILAFVARAELKRTNGERGAVKAVVGGAVMIVGMGMIGGVLVLIGGILATQNQPRTM